MRQRAQLHAVARRPARAPWRARAAGVIRGRRALRCAAPGRCAPALRSLARPVVRRPARRGLQQAGRGARAAHVQFVQQRQQRLAREGLGQVAVAARLQRRARIDASSSLRRHHHHQAGAAAFAPLARADPRDRSPARSSRASPCPPARCRASGGAMASIAAWPLAGGLHGEGRSGQLAAAVSSRCIRRRPPPARGAGGSRAAGGASAARRRTARARPAAVSRPEPRSVSVSIVPTARRCASAGRRLRARHQAGRIGAQAGAAALAAGDVLVEEAAGHRRRHPARVVHCERHRLAALERERPRSPRPAASIAFFTRLARIE